MSGPREILRWESAALPEIARPLIAEAIAGDYAWMGAIETEWQKRPFLEAGEGLFLAVENGAALGMAAIRRDPLAEDVVTGRLCFIFVSGRARKRGLAEALVTACLTRSDMHWSRVTLHTDNPVAAALYGRHGFTAVPGGTRTTHQRG